MNYIFLTRVSGKGPVDCFLGLLRIRWLVRFYLWTVCPYSHTMVVSARAAKTMKCQVPINNQEQLQEAEMLSH